MNTNVSVHDLDPVLKKRALDVADEGIIITDVRQPDGPVIFANQGFVRLTGYSAGEVLGRNCRFLQGSETDPAAAAEIRQAVEQRRSCVVEILNYRKDGTPFWNRLSITPVHDAAGEVTHFIGVQSDVTARHAAESALRAANEALEAAGRRMRRGLDAAARIQRALLPAALPQIEGVRFAYGFRPCDELAGDALNVLRLGDDCVGLYVLDVSGHGVPAALMSVTLTRFLSPSFDRTFLLSPAPGHPSGRSITAPARVAELLNQQFPMDPETSQYFTMLYGVLDVAQKQLRFVAAGHPAPVLARCGERPRFVESSGVPIGLLEDPGFTDTCLQMVAGDRLLLYSDGVSDADGAGDHELQKERLLTIVEQTRGLELQAAVNTIVAAVETWSPADGPGDDVSLLGVDLAG